MNKLKLEPAAALMLELGRESFSGEVIQSFIDHLDLSSAEKLFEECKAICDWYGEVVLNWKYFVNNFINEELLKCDDEHLIIIPGAGETPLALELLSKNYDKIDRILEIDLQGMDEKKELYDKYFPQYSDKIKCITADITSGSILSFLNGILWDYYNDIECCVILEGITYYLSNEELEKILHSFKSPQKRNKILIEYLLPVENVSEQLRNIPSGIFGMIKKSLGLKEIYRFDHRSLSNMMKKCEGNFNGKYSLVEMEKMRTGKNKYFQQPSDSWIECSVWEV
jgi:hypothetical protein